MKHSGPDQSLSVCLSTSQYMMTSLQWLVDKLCFASRISPRVGWGKKSCLFCLKSRCKRLSKCLFNLHDQSYSRYELKCSAVIQNTSYCIHSGELILHGCKQIDYMHKAFGILFSDRHWKFSCNWSTFSDVLSMYWSFCNTEMCAWFYLLSFFLSFFVLLFWCHVHI